MEPGEAFDSQTTDDLESSFPVVPEGATSLQAEGLRALVRNNPGARIISASEVQLSEGVVVDFPAAPNDVQSCPTFWLCLSEHANFGGEQIRFFNCGDENLGNYRMTNGRNWRDVVSSIRNAQAGSNAQARFYTFDSSGITTPSHWKLILGLNIGSYLRDLSKDTSLEGGNANDKIDIVHVCG